jgi:hypothetical protein
MRCDGRPIALLWWVWRWVAFERSESKVPDGTQPEGLRIRRSADPSRITVTIGEEGRGIDMRMGDVLDRATGEVSSVLGDGAVRINRGGNASR